MNTDFRLAIDFWQHPKTKKLIRRAGLEGVRSLQILWAWTACNRPNGSLVGMDDEDIELAADWDGDIGTLVKVMTELRWIDATENGYVLHDWQDHNPWAADAEARGDKARLSRLRQVNPAAYEQCVAEGKTAISQREYDELKTINGERRRNAGETPANASAAPAPSPSPSLIKDPPLPPHQGGTGARYSQEFDAFWSRYPRKEGKEAAWKKWQALKREKRLPAMSVLIDAVERAKATEQWQRDGGQYIPHPATWLNQGRWMDEPVPEYIEPPSHRAPPPPEMFYPDIPPEITEETRKRIDATKARLAGRMTA